MRYLFLLAAIFLLHLPVLAEDVKGAVPVPPGVRYQPASADEDRAALEQFRQMLAGSEKLSSIVMLGPILSDRLGDLDVGDVISGTYQLPLVEGALICEGWILRGEESTNDISSRLLKLVGSQPTFRRPSSTEMEYYWALAPFDLEGSIFVCEGQGRQLFWNFVRGEMSYLEDVTDIGDSFDTATQKLVQLPQTIQEPQVQPDYIAGLDAGEPVPEPLQGLDEVESSTLILLTPEELLELRTTSHDISGYLKPIIEKSQKWATENNLKQSFVQIDLSSGRLPVLRVGGRPAPSEELQASFLAELETIEPPKVMGPVCIFSVECPE